MEHLRLMETNAGVRRRPGPIARTTAAAAEACYASMFPRGGEGEGEGGGAEEASSRRGVECTYEILYMTGWSPGDGQQQPAERGSATVSLAKLEEELAKVSEGGPDGEGGAKGAGGGAAWGAERRALETFESVRASSSFERAHHRVVLICALRMT